MFDPNTRVLIVDDMGTMRKIIGKACRELGFTDISEAVDGHPAWDAVAAANPPFGLIISDYNMPNGNGLDFLRKVRADERVNKTPFVMLTSESEQALIAEAVRSGVDNYIVKPFTGEILLRKLQETFIRIAKRPPAA